MAAPYGSKGRRFLLLANLHAGPGRGLWGAGYKISDLDITEGPPSAAPARASLSSSRAGAQWAVMSLSSSWAGGQWAVML